MKVVVVNIRGHFLPLKESCEYCKNKNYYCFAVYMERVPKGYTVAQTYIWMTMLFTRITFSIIEKVLKIDHLC